MNGAMLSIVRHRTRPDNLLVHARLAGHIDWVFPQTEVVEEAGSDYRFRAFVPRPQVADAFSQRLLDIDSGNFKNSVHETKRHEAHFDVWRTMHGLQEGAGRARG